MKATDIMTSPVTSVDPEALVVDIARLLLARRISAVPVVVDQDRVIGMVSEGDLMRRPESGTDGTSSWWLALLGSAGQAQHYLKTHGLRARDVMTRPVITVGPDASLEEIADLLERNRIKRVPVIEANRLIGIVSRANLLHGLVARTRTSPTGLPTDAPRLAREAVIAELRATGLSMQFVNVVVAEDTVHLWGAVESEVGRAAIVLAAERIPGVGDVEDHLAVLPPRLIGALGIE